MIEAPITKKPCVAEANADKANSLKVTFSILTLTCNCYFLLISTNIKQKQCLVEEPVNDVGVINKSVVNHLSFSRTGDNKQCRYLLDFITHLDKYLLSVIIHS